MDLSMLSNEEFADLLGNAIRALKGRVAATGDEKAMRLYRLTHRAARELRDQLASPDLAGGPIIQPMSGGEPTEE